MIPALVLLAQLAVASRVPVELPKTFPTNSGGADDPAHSGQRLGNGWILYETQTSGYNSMMAYGYKRHIFIVVGPPELPEGVPGDPPNFDIRWAILGVKELISVPAGQVCDPAAPMWHEYGEALFGPVIYGSCNPLE
jgi:hypothetical protein